MSVVLDIVFTEKSVRLASAGQYSFLVDKKASAEKIIQEIEKMYGVHIIKINTLNNSTKIKGRGKYSGRTIALKKAIVTLKKGEEITEFKVETAEEESKKKTSKEDQKSKKIDNKDIAKQVRSADVVKSDTIRNKSTI